MRVDVQEIARALDAVIAKEIKIGRAAATLGFSRRHLLRLLDRYVEEGPGGLISRHKGQPGSGFSDSQKSEAVRIVTELYPDFGPTFASEKLEERHDFQVSRETLRGWMIEAGVWQDRYARRRRIQQLREPSPRRGMLVQVDGSHHRWFEKRGPSCVLIVFIDDATSELGCLHFAESENTLAYMVGLQKFIDRLGKPLALFSDKHSVFYSSHANLDRTSGTTQFGAVLNRLRISMICAETSQAKGRVERSNRTLQDRLVKELRLREISTIEAANEFADEYMDMFNAKFAKAPLNPIDAYQACVSSEEVSHWIRWEETRKVSQMLALNYNKVRFMLDDSARARRTIGKDVTVCEYPDGRVIIEHDGQALPYRTFDKLRRVSRPDVVDSKELTVIVDRMDQDLDPDDLEPASRSSPEIEGVPGDDNSPTGDHGEAVNVEGAPAAKMHGEAAGETVTAQDASSRLRKVSRNLSFQFRNLRFVLAETDENRQLIGEYVEVIETPTDGVVVRRGNELLKWTAVPAGSKRSPRIEEVTPLGVVQPAGPIEPSNRLSAGLALAEAIQKVLPHHRQRNRSSLSRRGQKANPFPDVG